MDNSKYKVCEVCGQEKHISEFSKSYKNQCKDCVASRMRETRRKLKKMFPTLTPAIDWEQRRYEIAKSAIQGFCSNSEPNMVHETTFQKFAKWAVEIADTLITELKKGGQNV